MRGRFGAIFVVVASVCGLLVVNAEAASANPTSTSGPTATVSTTVPEPTSTTTTTTTTTAPPTTTTTTTLADDLAGIVGNENPSQRDPNVGLRQGPIARGGIRRGNRGPMAQVVPFPTTTTTIPVAERLPPNSGNGKRIVYYKSGQRVWLVDDNNRVLKTYLVSGRLTWNQPSPGHYSVFSRSRWTCAVNNPSVCWPYMIRFTYGPGGLAIGFHEIPTNRATGRKLQSISQLGTPLSSGCVRQAPWDAAFLWGWAPVGTRVVVIQ